MTRVPHFWWDFHRPAEGPVLVESDDPKYPVVAVFPCAFETSEPAIEKAIALIKDLDAGRKDYRRLARSCGGRPA